MEIVEYGTPIIKVKVDDKYILRSRSGNNFSSFDYIGVFVAPLRDVLSFGVRQDSYFDNKTKTAWYEIGEVCRTVLDNQVVDSPIVMKNSGSWVSADIRAIFESSIVEATDQGLGFKEVYSSLCNGEFEAIKDMLAGLRPRFN